MNRDERLQHLPAALVNCSAELEAAGLPPLQIGAELLEGARRYLDGRVTADQAAALFRHHGALAENPDRTPLQVSEREHLELLDNAGSYLRNLQLSGIDESTAVAALHQACVLAVVRTRGAVGAAAWLHRIAALTEMNAPSIETAAKAS